MEILRRRQLDFPESVGNGNDDHFFVGLHPFGMTLELASSVPSIPFYNSIYILYYIDTCVYREKDMLDIMYIGPYIRFECQYKCWSRTFSLGSRHHALGRVVDSISVTIPYSMLHTRYCHSLLFSFILSNDPCLIREFGLRLERFLFLYYTYIRPRIEREMAEILLGYIKYGRRRIWSLPLSCLSLPPPVQLLRFLMQLTNDINEPESFRFGRVLRDVWLDGSIWAAVWNKTRKKGVPAQKRIERIS